MPRPDPTRPLSQRTPEELGEFIDDRLLMALAAADLLNAGALPGDSGTAKYVQRQCAEDYVRDRLVALSDTYPEPEMLAAAERERRMNRLRDALGIGVTEVSG